MSTTLQVVQAFDTYKAGDEITGLADSVAQALQSAYPGRFQFVSSDGTGGGTTPVPPLPVVTPASDLPADFVFAITPDPNNDLPRSTRAIRCQVGGTMVVNTVGGSQAVTLAFADGETRPVRVTRVLSITGCVGVEGMA